MDNNKLIIVLITITVIVGMGLIACIKAGQVNLQISKERTKYEIIEKCNYIKTPTVQCVDALSKSLKVGE